MPRNAKATVGVDLKITNDPAVLAREAANVVRELTNAVNRAMTGAAPFGGALNSLGRERARVGSMVAATTDREALRVLERLTTQLNRLDTTLARGVRAATVANPQFGYQNALYGLLHQVTDTRLPINRDALQQFRGMATQRMGTLRGLITRANNGQISGTNLGEWNTELSEIKRVSRMMNTALQTAERERTTIARKESLERIAIARMEASERQRLAGQAAVRRDVRQTNAAYTAGINQSGRGIALNNYQALSGRIDEAMNGGRGLSANEVQSYRQQLGVYGGILHRGDYAGAAAMGIANLDEEIINRRQRAAWLSLQQRNNTAFQRMPWYDRLSARLTGGAPGASPSMFGNLRESFHSANHLTTNVSQLAGQSLYGLGMVGLGAGAITGAVEQEKQAQQVQSVLAGVINTYRQFHDEMGRGVSQADNYIRAMSRSKTLYQELRDAADKSLLTQRELAQFYETSAPMGLRHGLGESQVLQTVTQVATLGRAMNYRDPVILHDIRELMDPGGRYANNLIGRALGITKQDRDDAFKGGPDAYMAFMKEKLKGFQPVFDDIAHQLGTSVTTFLDNLNRTGMAVGKGIIPGLQNTLKTFDDAAKEWISSGRAAKFGESLGHTLEAVGGALGKFVNFMAENVKNPLDVALLGIEAMLGKFTVQLALSGNLMGAAFTGITGIIMEIVRRLNKAADDNRAEGSNYAAVKSAYEKGAGGHFTTNERIANADAAYATMQGFETDDWIKTAADHHAANTRSNVGGLIKQKDSAYSTLQKWLYADVARGNVSKSDVDKYLSELPTKGGEAQFPTSDSSPGAMVSAGMGWKKIGPTFQTVIGQYLTARSALAQFPPGDVEKAYGMGNLVSSTSEDVINRYTKAMQSYTGKPLTSEQALAMRSGPKAIQANKLFSLSVKGALAQYAKDHPSTPTDSGAVIDGEPGKPKGSWGMIKDDNDVTSYQNALEMAGFGVEAAQERIDDIKAQPESQKRYYQEIAATNKFYNLKLTEIEKQRQLARASVASQHVSFDGNYVVGFQNITSTGALNDAMSTMAQKHGWAFNHLMGIVRAESGFKSGIQKDHPNRVGLISWDRASLKDSGFEGSIKDFAKLAPEDQVPYLENFLTNKGVRNGASLEDLTRAVEGDARHMTPAMWAANPAWKGRTQQAIVDWVIRAGGLSHLQEFGGTVDDGMKPLTDANISGQRNAFLSKDKQLNDADNKAALASAKNERDRMRATDAIYKANHGYFANTAVLSNAYTIEGMKFSGEMGMLNMSQVSPGLSGPAAIGNTYDISVFKAQSAHDIAIAQAVGDLTPALDKASGKAGLTKSQMTALIAKIKAGNIKLGEPYYNIQQQYHTSALTANNAQKLSVAQAGFERDQSMSSWQLQYDRQQFTPQMALSQLQSSQAQDAYVRQLKGQGLFGSDAKIYGIQSGIANSEDSIKQLELKRSQVPQGDMSGLVTGIYTTQIMAIQKQIASQEKLISAINDNSTIQSQLLDEKEQKLTAGILGTTTVPTPASILKENLQKVDRKSAGFLMGMGVSPSSAAGKAFIQQQHVGYLQTQLTKDAYTKDALPGMESNALDFLTSPNLSHYNVAGALGGAFTAFTSGAPNLSKFAIANLLNGNKNAPKGTSDLTDVAQIGASMLVSAFTKQNSFGQEGAGLGGMIGTSIGGPIGGALGTLAGGFLGGLFGKHQEDPAVDAYRKKMIDLLDHIDRSLRPVSDYYKTKVQMFNADSAYLSGRSLGFHDAIGAF